MSPVLPLLGARLLRELQEHAAEEAPRECCGLLVHSAELDKLYYLRSRNLHTGPEGHDTFILDPDSWTAADHIGEVIAVVHSHPNASANPSMADRVQCERSGLPWLIVGTPSGVVVELGPSGWQAPLEGREFAFGVLDCYTLVQDWYLRTWGLELPDFEREDGFWERGQHLYRDGLAQAGFMVVDTTEPQPGDGLLMRVMSPDIDNHAAVYLGEGFMLHHLYGQPSRRERWDWPWQRRTTAVVRHRSRLVGGA